jgi:hypothetical protein
MTCINPPLFVVLMFVLAVASAADSEELAGTRPGPDDQPLNVNCTLFLLDVSKIDGANQSFTADVFMMLQWEDERLATPGSGVRRLPLASVWNPRVQIINQRRVWKTFPEQVDVTPDGMVTYRQRFYGEFSSPLDLHDFPLDRHTFALEVVVPGYRTDEIVMVPNIEGFEEARSPEMTIPDWSITDFRIESSPWSIIPGARQIPGLKGTFEAQRHLGFYVGKAFVSVAIIVFMSWVVFWIAPEHVGPRLSVAVTSMLTLVAYRFLLGQGLPPVSYLTLLDYFLLGSTILVFFALIQVAVTSAMDGERGRSRSAAINKMSRLAFPAVFLLLFAALFWV